MDINKIRNFCIIAHIDHGKSTLADRMLEVTSTVEKRDMKSQHLDSMDLEQERGITIKLQPVRMNYKGYELNLIDTPGHVDFQYEVSRSLASVEGAVLVVDATQGIEAQTLSNLYMAIDNDLDIIPVINKIDLPAADVAKVSAEIISLIGCSEDEIIPISAKTGQNVEAVLEAVIDRVKEPQIFEMENKEGELKALVFDSQYDNYKGVVSYLKVFSGDINKGDNLYFLNTKTKIEALEVGYFAPKYVASGSIKTGEIGYIVTGLKSIREAQVGDTVWKKKGMDYKQAKAIEGFKKVTPFIFAGVYPISTDEYPQMKQAVEKLMLNDSALSIENEVSPALGHGFRCGFLGLLHMDIVKERLYRESGIEVIITSPQVTYKVKIPGNKVEDYSRFRTELIEEEGRQFTYVYMSNPEDLPKRELYMSMEEPITKCEIITPKEYVGALMQLSQERRGIFLNQSFLDENRVMLSYELPLNELIGDFYDSLKSLSSGYASMNYEFLKYREDDMIKLDILVAGDKVDALSLIVHRSQAAYTGGKIVRNLKDIIPKHLFSIALQAAIGAKVVAREDISAMRKDVTAKLYGGDVSRKRKLLDKQKEGKKKMKKIGRVDLPSEAFISILKKN